VNYDFLKLKTYDCRVEVSDGSPNKYMLSFNERQHIKVSETAKKIMDCFDGNKTLMQIYSELKEMNISFSFDELSKFVDESLVSNSILEGMEYDTKGKGSSYMWCHIPIVDSNKLSWFFEILKVLYVKWISIVVLIIILLSAVFSGYQVITNGVGFNQVNSLGLILLGYLSLIFHEFGHIAAAYKQKIRVGSIGIGMYLFNPVMYVDMTNAWRLDYKGRVLVDVGGMYFQLITIVPLTVIGFFFHNNFIYIVNISIIGMTIMNLIPFIKLDGYWILCDYLRLDNISTNAFHIVIKMAKGIFGKREDEQVLDLKNTKEQRIYFVFALIYTLSTVFMLVMGVILTIKVLGNLDTVRNNIITIFNNIQANQWDSALALMNKTFIFILPLFFLGVMLIRIVINFLKQLIGGEQSHDNDKGFT
jgi:putative peptide zinc metalloprotease protein